MIVAATAYATLIDLSFDGTAYLFLHRHPDMLAWLGEGLARYGLHYGGSRRSPRAPAVYAEAETRLAAWTGAPAALLVSSGTLAARLALRALTENGGLHLHPHAHAALRWSEEEAVHHHEADWQASILADLQRQRSVVAAADSVDALRVRRPDWQWLTGLSPEAPLTLLVDDSHAIGLWGEHGGGSWRRLRQSWSGPLVVVASLGKALSLPAGIILGEESFVEQLRATAPFGGASPPSPAYLHAWLSAERLIAGQRSRLADNIELFERLAPMANFHGLPDYPVFGTSHHALADFLATRHLHLSSFSYPRATDPRITRIVLNAGHGPEDILRLTDALHDFFGGA